MSEMHLKQPGFTYSGLEHLLKNKNEKYKNKKWEIQDILIKSS